MSNTLTQIAQNTFAKIALSIIEENENGTMEEIVDMIEILMAGNGVQWKSESAAYDAAKFRAEVIGDEWALFEMNKIGITVKEAFGNYLNNEATDIYSMIAALLVFTNMNTVIIY